ncbi:MAG: VOC family protein [Alphaproteobacteria bacterium]|jgi:catechol 2,3-dioxygenase-like lactoylglutathione lyase family enzyme
MNDKTPNIRWGHININVSNLDRSVAFYKRLGFEDFRPGIPYLGLTNDTEPAALPDDSARALGLSPGTRGRACILQLGDGYPKLDLTEFVALGASETPEKSPEQPLTNQDIGIVRLCLATRNLAEDFESLSKQGVIFLSAPQPAKDGMADIATCIDPDGALIELIQVHRDKWPAPPSTGG